MAYTKEQWERWKREHPGEWEKRKRKISKSRMGQRLSDSHRKAIAKAMQGRRLSVQQRKKIAASVKIARSRPFHHKYVRRLNLGRIRQFKMPKPPKLSTSRNTLAIFGIFAIAIIFSFGLTNLGLFAQDDWAKHWENRKDITVDNNVEYVTTHIAFGFYKPEKCEDGIMVATSNQNVSFEITNPVFGEDVCSEADVTFLNLIYAPIKFDIQFAEPTPADGAIITDHNFTVSVRTTETANLTVLEWGINNITTTDALAGSDMEWSHDLTGLIGGTTYSYRVLATNLTGDTISTEFRTVTVEKSAEEIAAEIPTQNISSTPENATENSTGNITEDILENITIPNVTEKPAESIPPTENITVPNETSSDTLPQQNITNSTPTGATLEPPRETYYVYYGKKPAETLTEINFEEPTPPNGICIAEQDWIYINATANANVKTAVLQWSADGVTDSIMMGGGGMEWHYNITGLASGVYTFLIFAEDENNATIVSETRTVDLLTELPEGSIQFDKGTYYAVPGETFTAKIKVKNPTDKKVKLTLSPAFDSRLKMLKAEKPNANDGFQPTGGAVKTPSGGLTTLAVDKTKKIESMAEYASLSPKLKKPDGFDSPTFESDFEAGEELEFYVTFQAPRQPGKGEFFFYALGDGLSLAVDPWWNTNWSYSKNVTVTDSSGSALKYYDVRIVLDTASLIAAGKMQSGCADIRFANSSGNQIDYWLESNCSTTTTSIWIEVPNIPASGSETVSMYYGNPSAPTASNGNTTFPFFDDFPGTALDGTKWTATGAGSATVANSVVTLNADKYIIGSYIFAPNQEIVWNATTSVDGGSNYLYFGTSDDAITSFMLINTFYGYISSKASTSTSTARSDPSTAYRMWGIQWNTTANYFVNYSYRAQHSNTYAPAVNQKAFARAFTTSTNVKADWVFVHNMTWPSPTYSIGSENTAANLSVSFASTAATDEAINVQANYTDSAGNTLTGANCTLTVSLPGQDIESFPMAYNATTLNYTYNYTAHRTGVSNVSVSCNATDYSVLTASPKTLTVTGAWWDTQYQYRKNLTVANNGLLQLSNYAVRTIVDTASLISAGKMMINCSDMRFANSSGYYADHWIEGDCNSANTAIWIELPSLEVGANENISMYYGNTGAYRNASDGDAVFPLFDHFDMPSSTLNSTKWTTDNSGFLAISNSILTISGRSVAAYPNIFSVQQFSPGQDVEWNITSSVDGDSYNIYWGYSTPTISQFILIYADTAAQFEISDGTPVTATRTNSMNTYRRWSVLWNSTGAYFYADGSYDNKITSHVPTTSLRAFAMNAAPTTTIKIDWMFVRNKTLSEPTYSTGSEEAKPLGGGGGGGGAGTLAGPSCSADSDCAAVSGTCRSTPGGLKFCVNVSAACVRTIQGNAYANSSQGAFPFAESNAQGSGLRCYNGYWAFDPLKLNPNVTFAEYDFTATDSDANYKIKLPLNVFVSRADLKVSGNTYNGLTPYAPSVDIGNDGYSEWALNSPNMLYDNCTWGGGAASTQAVSAVNWVAQSFTAPANSTMALVSVTGGRPAVLAGTERLIAEIRTDSGNQPSSTVVNARSYAMNVFGTALPSTDAINITIPTRLAPSATYWIVLRGASPGTDASLLLSNQVDPSCSGTAYTSADAGNSWSPANGDLVYEIRDATNLTQALSPMPASLVTSRLSELPSAVTLGCSCTGCSVTDTFYCEVPVNASLFYGGQLTLSDLRVEYLGQQGAACLDDRDCRSGYCRTDYNGLKFCASNATNCVFNSTQRGPEGPMYTNSIYYGSGYWWCDSGHWGKDPFSNTRNDTYVTLNFSTAGFDKTTNISINSSVTLQSATLKITGRANLTFYKNLTFPNTIDVVYSDSDFIYAGEQDNVHVISKSNWTDFKTLATPISGSPISVVSDENNVYVASGQSKTVFAYRKSDWVKVQNLLMPNNIDCLATDEKYLYTGSSDVWVLDKASWQLAYTLSTNDDGLAKSLATDDRYLYVGTNYGNITVYDKNKFEPQFFFAPTSGTGCGTDGCAVLSMDADYKYLYAADNGGSAFAIPKEDWTYVPNIITQRLGVAPGALNGTVATSITADNKYVFVGSDDGTVQMYDLLDWTNKRNLTESSGKIYSVWRDDYGDWLYSGSNDRSLRIYNWSYPKNPTIDVGLDQSVEWSYSGVFNQSAGTRTLDFTAALQSLLGSCNCAGCTLKSGQCNISINVTSDSPGIMELDQLDVTYGCSGDNDGDGFSTLGGDCGPIDCDDGNATVIPPPLYGTYNVSGTKVICGGEYKSKGNPVFLLNTTGAGIICRGTVMDGGWQGGSISPIGVKSLKNNTLVTNCTFKNYYASINLVSDIGKIFNNTVTFNNMGNPTANAGNGILSDYDSHNHTVANNNVTQVYVGIWLVQDNGWTIANNFIGRSNHGIMFYDYSTGNNITNNTIENIYAYGIFEVSFNGDGSDHTIEHNTIRNVGYAGIRAGAADILYNNITNVSSNDYSNSHYGIFEGGMRTIGNNVTFVPNGVGMSVEGFIANNTVTNASSGYKLVSNPVSEVNYTLHNNTFINCTQGIVIQSSPGGKMRNFTVRSNALYDNRMDLNVSYQTFIRIIDQKAGTYSIVDSAPVFENTSAGKIAYINATNYQFVNITQNGTNLSADVFISHNRAYINSTRAPGLNYSANVTLYYITYANPIPQRAEGDSGAYYDCQDIYCFNMSHVGDTFLFNVTNFTSYKAKEGFNLPPWIYNIIIDDDIAFPYQQIDLVAGGTKNVVCNATADDPDGTADMNSTLPKGVFYDIGLGSNSADCTPSNLNCYRNDSCTWLGLKNATSQYFECRFNVWYNANASGSDLYWRCELNVTDSADHKVSAYEATDINMLIGVGTPNLIPFGTMAPNTLTANDVNATIQNFGNVFLDLSLNGSALTCAMGSIEPQYLHYNCLGYDSNYYTNMVPLMASPDEENCTGFALIRNLSVTDEAPKAPIKDLPWKLKTPSAIRAGGCEGLIMFAGRYGGGMGSP